MIRVRRHSWDDYPEIGFVGLVLQEVHGHILTLNRWSKGPNERGERHTDPYDIYVAQIRGQQTWILDGKNNFTTVAGDVVFLPKNTRHHCRTGDEPSVHLTFGVR